MIDLIKLQNFTNNKKSQQSELKIQLNLHKKSTDDSKLILSIDRLDYTKGVINRMSIRTFFRKKLSI